MTGDGGSQSGRHTARRRTSGCGRAALLCILSLVSSAALAAEPTYPFVGTWIRSDRVCLPSATRVRTYTAKDVTSSRGHCSIRRIASGSGNFELLEECRRNDRTQTVTEIIKVVTPDTMTLRRQFSRLKIPRTLRYSRCTVAEAPAAHRPH